MSEDGLKIRNFKDDCEESYKIKDEWSKVIKTIFGKETKIMFKDDNISQLDFGSDLIIILKNGRKYSIDHKTRNFNYFENKTYLLEIVHHRYKDKKCKEKLNSTPGWLYKSTSDYIFIGTLSENKNNIIEVIGFSLIPFKLEEFKSEYNNMKNGWAKTDFGNGIFQLTLNKKIDIEYIKENALQHWYMVIK